jgi:hypothetical protein
MGNQNIFQKKNNVDQGHGYEDHARLRLTVARGKGEAVGLSERELTSAMGLGSPPQRHEEVEQVKVVLIKAKIS